MALAFATVANAFVVAGNAFLLGCGRVGRRAALTALAPWLYALLVAVVWIMFGLTVARAALSFGAAEAVWAILLIAASIRGIGLARPCVTLLGESIRFGARAWVGTLSSFANARADQILMGFMVSEATLGIYAVAVNGAEVLLLLPQATASVLLPVLAQGSAAAGVDRSLRVFRYTSVVTVGGIVVAAVLGPELLTLLFGSAYDASTVPFLWLLPGAIGFAPSVFSSALLAASSPGRSSVGPMVALVTGLGLDLILIPPFGASGAAAAASAALLAGGAATVR